MISSKQGPMGCVADLIQYFNLNKQIFEKEKNNKQHMQRIMAMLTQQNMKILQKQFQLYTKGLQLPTFIYLMKKLYIPQDDASKYYFVSDLIKFFQAIDVNGDGHLEWSQFTQYIIENIRRVDKPNYKNKAFQQNEIISSAYSKISNQYKITKIIDAGASNTIKKVVYAIKEEKYFVLQSGSNVVKIFNSSFYQIDIIILKGDSESSYIFDFSFDQANQVFCALFEGSARFCNIKMAGNVKFLNQVENKKLKNYHKIQHLSQHKLWAFLSKNGDVKLSTVSFQNRTQMAYTCQITLKQHQSLITDISQIEQPKYIITSSMDGTIKLYSVALNKWQTLQHISEQTHSVINTKNKKGILSIDYTRQFGSYILAFGFSTNVFIYSLDISLTKGYTGKYTQHSGNMLSAKFLKSYPYVLSFDDKLNLRIWDFRTFQTMQIINCEKNFINPSCLQIIPQLSQCLICQKKITQFRAPSLQKKSKQINEFYSIFDFKICSVTNNIFVFTSNDVRVYNYITGALIHVFTKLDQNSFQTNITAAQFGYKSRKFFLGDAAGYVREYDSQTGDFLQEVKPSDDIQYQNKAIIKIIFLKEHSLLLVCSEDGRIMIYQRNSQSQFIIIRDIRETHQQLTCANASARYCLLATGSQNGTINIWNLQKFSLQAVFVLQHKIVNIAFSPIHPIIIITDVSGIISFFYIRPNEDIHLRYKCFLKIQNRDNRGLLQRISSFSFDLIINAYFDKRCSLIQNVSDCKHHFIVTLGQQNGCIVEANLNEIIGLYKIQENHQIFSTKKSIRCEIQNARTLIASERNKILNFSKSSNSHAEIMDINEFKNVRRFQAHNVKIDQLLLVKQNCIIITTSADKKLKVWSLQGELNGAIDFFTFKKIHWKVCEINFHKKIQAIQTCIYAIKLIQNRKFTEKEQQQIKINLLMNQFMDQKQKSDYFKWFKMILKKRNPKIRSRKLKNKNSFIGLVEKIQNSNVSSENSDNDQFPQNQVSSKKSLKRLNQDFIQQLSNDQIQQNYGTSGIQSMSNKQFEKIYKKLHNQITQKLNQQCIFSIKKTNFSPIDINSKVRMMKGSKTEKKSKEIKYEQQKSTSNNSIKRQNRIRNQKSKTGYKREDQFMNFQDNIFKCNKQNPIVPNERIITNKQEMEIEQLFRKTMQNYDKNKGKIQKKSNILYQNLSEARRKIKGMNNSLKQSHRKTLAGFKNYII